MNVTSFQITGFGGRGRKKLGPILGLWVLLAVVAGQAAGILGTKHDLSVGGTGAIKAVTESEVCLFCHTPHRATGQTPLWNHALSAATYTPYSSSTMKGSVGQPTGASKLCLSCHDGTVALGMVNSRATPIEMQSGVTTMPAGRTRIGTDLSDDHPVSFKYDSALAAANGQLKDPVTLTTRVRVDHNSEMQCTSCHDPHDNQYDKFLVQDNNASALCLNCHNPNYWVDSAHRNSTKTWNGAGQNPWPNTDRKTVAANACENCHATHAAGTRERLLTFADEELNCNSCHNGNVAAKNVQAEFNKPSAHPILSTRGVHDPMEDPVNPPRHVECVDCHNPHAARTGVATVPNASGALAGLDGINLSGSLVHPLSYEYELCFRCHADSIARGRARVNRQFVQTNTRLDFAAANASYHPVAAPGKNSYVPSLIAPWTTSSRMYCTDCHNNNQGPGNGGSGAKGPHGSTFTPILERQLVLSDGNSESFGIYAMCYKCHDRNSILSNQGWSDHRRHIIAAKGACTTCHDPHGVQNTTHLINFNTTYVTASSEGRLEYIDTGSGSGTCSLRCHNKDHRAAKYP